MILRFFLILLLFPFFEAKVYGLVYTWLRPEWGVQIAIEAIILAQLMISFLGFKLMSYQLRKLGGGFFTHLQQQGPVPLEEAGSTVFYALAGLIFMIPGFGTDVLALTLLLKPVQRLARRSLLHRMQAYFHIKMQRRGFPGDGFSGESRTYTYTSYQRPSTVRKDLHGTVNPNGHSSGPDVIDVDVVER